MRQILIDFYRAKKAGKRGGEGIAVTLDDSIAAEDMRELDVVDLDRALNELSEVNPKGAELLELRFFVGLTLEETAAALDISVASVKREQLASECWLAARLRGKAE
jgi:RNA polymerase sigma factor (TIGR02999 family)